MIDELDDKYLSQKHETIESSCEILDLQEFFHKFPRILAPGLKFF